MNIQEAIKELEKLISMLDGYYQNMQKESSTTQEEMEKQLEKINSVLSQSTQIIGNVELLVEKNYSILTKEQKQKIIEKLKSIQTIAEKYQTLKQSISNEIKRLRASKECHPEGKRQYRIMTADEYEREVKKYIESINIDEIDTIYELQYIWDVLDNIYPNKLEINSNRTWCIMPDYTFCVVDGDIFMFTANIQALQFQTWGKIRGYFVQKSTDIITQKDLEEFICSFIEKIRKKNIQCPHDYKIILDAIDECKKTINSVFLSASADINSIGYTGNSRIKSATKVEVTDLNRLKELKQKIDQISEEERKRTLLNYKKDGRKITDKEIEELRQEQESIINIFNLETELFNKLIMMKKINRYTLTFANVGIIGFDREDINLSAAEYTNYYPSNHVTANRLDDYARSGLENMTQFFSSLKNIKEKSKTITQEELENMINSYLNDINPNNFNNLHKCMFEKNAILDYKKCLEQIQEASKEGSSGTVSFNIIIDEFNYVYYVNITDQERLQRLIEALERKFQELDERIIDICIKKAQEEDSHFANSPLPEIIDEELGEKNQPGNQGKGGR